MLFPTVQPADDIFAISTLNISNLGHSVTVVIRNNLCINIQKHFSPQLTMLSPYLVKLGTSEMTDIP